MGSSAISECGGRKGLEKGKESALLDVVELAERRDGHEGVELLSVLANTLNQQFVEVLERPTFEARRVRRDVRGDWNFGRSTGDRTAAQRLSVTTGASSPQ